MAVRPLFRHVDVAVVRATMCPAGLGVPPVPSAPGCDDAAAWRAWIRRVWSIPAVAEAVEYASPVLAGSVGEILAGRVGELGRLRRAGTALHRYTLRLQHRATPFGLFAGVAPARAGERLRLRWGAAHRVVARADAVWLAGLTGRLEADAEVLRLVPVVVVNGFSKLDLAHLLWWE